jgi:murein DD-endopeptidase MepM/ murein hydrolase activator NlpD
MIRKLVSFIVNSVILIAMIGLMLGAASLFLNTERVNIDAVSTLAAITPQSTPQQIAAMTVQQAPAVTATPLPIPTPTQPVGPVRCQNDVWGLPLRPQGFRVTAKFGYKSAKNAYVTSLKKVGAVNENSAGVFHSGVDLAADTGDPVYSVMSGKIVYVGYSDQYGKHVIVESDVQRVLFAHLSQTLVRKNADVKCGQLIGLAGGTGKALTGPHLHLELREKKRDRAVDPLKFVVEAMDASSPVLAR